MGRTIDEVIEELSPERRARIEAKSRSLTAEMMTEAESLSMVRKAHDKTQEEIAQRLGIKTNAVTQLEKRTDMLLSTLRKYIRACGADLMLSVRTREGHTVMLESLMALTVDAKAPLRASPRAAAKPVTTVRKRATLGVVEKAKLAKPKKRQPVHA